MERTLSAYSIGSAIAGFINKMHELTESTDEFMKRINLYTELLLDDDKEPLILLLKREADYNSFAIDLLEMVYAF